MNSIMHSLIWPRPASSASSIILTFHLHLHYIKLIISPSEDYALSYFQVYINFPFLQNAKFHAASPGKVHRSFCHIYSLSTTDSRLSAVCLGRIHWISSICHSPLAFYPSRPIIVSSWTVLFLSPPMTSFLILFWRKSQELYNFICKYFWICF